MENVNTEQEIISKIEKEMSWNMARVHIASEANKKEYSIGDKHKNKTTLIYFGLPGSSIKKDLKEFMNSIGIKTKIFRGHYRTKLDDEHDYVIILK